LTGVKRKKRITSGKQNSLELSSSDTGQSSSTDRKLAVHLAGPGGDRQRQQTDDYPLATNLFRVTKFDFGWFIHTDNPKNMTPMQITFRGCDNFNSKAKMYLKYSSIMLGGKEVQLYLLFMLRKLHGKNPLNAYQVR